METRRVAHTPLLKTIIRKKYFKNVFETRRVGDQRNISTTRMDLLNTFWLIFWE